ncbi:MAG TPA: secretin N-terminal domain-containing protein, partial [Candidatus Polarisedimenticolia bacterium]|nr:secretin N-terminal domain-containing protein [Candidatus Polarisedimenticolia bacterium]
MARAQTYDDGQGQMVPPQNNGSTIPGNGNGPAQDQNGAAQNGSTQPSQPNVVLVPMQVPIDLQSSNFQVMPPDQGQQQQPPQGGGPNPNQTFRVLPPMGGGQNQNRNFDRRNRWGRRGDMAQRQSANTDPSAYAPPKNVGTNGTDGIMLNFHGAPIDEVLNYLSDAAGFIIELDTHVSGTIDVWSARPVSKDEAVQILNSVLNHQGYAAVRSGTRTLRIMSHDDALHSMIPVIEGGDPNTIPNNDEMVTQIIPIRNVQARQLITDLSPLISSGATIMANDAGNSIIVTDTQANIKHLAQIIQAIDGSAEDVTEVQVFHLQYHDPVEVANMLTSIFAEQS